MNTSDRDVIDDARRGDSEAFGRLVRSHQQRLFGLALMMVREPAGAEEVTQDAFVRAYTHLVHYDPSRPFYPWLAGIAVHRAQNWLRTRGRSIRREGTALEDAAEPQSGDSALTSLLADEQSGHLWLAVSALPSGERTVVTLRYRDELALADIARAMGVTTGTVKTLLFRARRHLRERLTASGTHKETQA